MQRIILSAAAFLVVLLAACREKPAEVEIDQTRDLTSADVVPKLMATSEERFRGTQRAANPHGAGDHGGGGTTYRFTKPEGWEQKSATQFRLLNFAIGAEGEGEAYVSVTQGDLLSNVARWRQQFGITDTTMDDLREMERVVVMETGEGLVVEATGTFSPGMGRPAAPGSALVGIIAIMEDGRVFSVKMTGPEAVVKAERPRFLEFCRTLVPVE